MKTGSKILSSFGIQEDLVSNLAEVIEAAEIEGVDHDLVSIDFGFARGIAYYTGMLFDIYADSGQDQTLGGGGRYDGLTRALGYDRDVPALGFAYNLDAVTALLEKAEAPTDDLNLVSPEDTGSVNSAVEEARKLRSSGKRAAVDFQVSRSATPEMSSEGEGTQ